MVQARKKPGVAPRPTAERFWEKVAIAGVNECWLWQRQKTKRGYGLFGFSVDGKTWKDCAHRVAYVLVNGPITGGLYVLHSCDNPSCVNPAHLSLGTQADNMRQASERGRLIRAPKQPRLLCVNGHRLTEANVARYSDGTTACRECKRASGRNTDRKRRGRRRVSVTREDTQQIPDPSTL